MPLLQGTFDPEKFNSTTIGKLMFEAFWPPPPPPPGQWPDVNARWVDAAQYVLDGLKAQGIIR